MAARAYTMRARAEAVEGTKQRILDVTRDLFLRQLDPDSMTLDQVASLAGVSTMTLVRHFGTKAALLEAVKQREMTRISAQRSAPAGDVKAAVSALYDHYEEAGDWGLRMQALEEARPGLHEGLQQARAMHRAWVEESFRPQLARVPVKQRADIITTLVVACDLLTWKQLRRDLGLSRRRAEAIVRLMVEALISGEA